ncbi:MAG: glycosyltransferase family 2 protein [Bacteroidales bacterium]
MIDSPLVSICIPTFNAELYIGETLQSILNQTYKNIEILIVDDCSKDKTVEVIRSFSDLRILLYQNEVNLGVEGNWNKVLLLSSGKYCKMMGADDILYPNCIEEQLKVFEDINNKGIVLVTSFKDVINQNGKVILNRKFPGKGRVKGITAIKKCLHRGTNVIGEPVAGLFRKEILEDTGYYNGENLYMIDIDLWIRILKFGDLFVIDKTLYAFRISTQSLSTNIGFAQVKLFNTFVDKLFADKIYHISIFDKMFSKTMALAMGIARNLIYLIYFKK